MLNQASSIESVNYWPAYVDVLVNVLIALLFVLSMFSIFSVVMRSNAFLIERHAPYGFDLSLSDHSKLIAGSAINQSDYHSLRLPVREDSFIKHDPIHLHFDDALSSVLPSNSKRILIDHSKSNLLDAIENQEAIQRTLISQINLLQSELADKKNPSQVKPDEVYKELIVTRASTYDLTVQDLLEKHSFDVVWKWVFSDRSTAPEKMEWPKEYIRAAATHGLQLLIFIEPDNPRQQREAYFRLMTIRSEAVRRGGDISGLRVRILPDADARRVSNPHATVFMLVSQGKE